MILIFFHFVPREDENNIFRCSQVSVRVRDKADHSVMSIESLLKHFKDEVAAFH